MVGHTASSRYCTRVTSLEMGVLVGITPREYSIFPVILVLILCRFYELDLVVFQEYYVLDVFRVVIIMSLISRKHVFLNIPLNKILVGSVNHGKATTGKESK